MPKPLLSKLIVQGAIGFFCVLFGCVYGLHTKDRIFLIMSLLIGAGSIIRVLALLHTTKKQAYTELTGTCIKREVSPLTKHQQILFQTADQTEYRFTLDKHSKLLTGHHYRLYFRSQDRMQAEQNPRPELLGYEELSSLEKPISESET